MPHLISLFALAVFPSCCCTNQCTMSCHTGVFIGPDERLKGPGPQGPRQPIHLSYYLGINGRFSSGESTCWWMKAEESLKYVLNLCWVALNLVWKYPYTLHSDKCHLRSGFMAFPVVIICTLRPGKPFLFYNFHCLPGKRKRISCPKALWRNANNFLA